jgi:hypothetical protein
MLTRDAFLVFLVMRLASKGSAGWSYQWRGAGADVRGTCRAGRSGLNAGLMLCPPNEAQAGGPVRFACAPCAISYGGLVLMYLAGQNNSGERPRELFKAGRRSTLRRAAPRRAYLPCALTDTAASRCHPRRESSINSTSHPTPYCRSHTPDKTAGLPARLACSSEVSAHPSRCRRR